MIDYRHQAREYLKHAKVELDLNDDNHLRYAALDLRFAIEALTYDRAMAYKAELPPSEYETWQPRKLMAVLIEIDPKADKDTALAVGIEPSYGAPPAIMNQLGTERVFNLPLLKKHYDALGSHLHMPTLKQAKSALPSTEKFRQRCDEVTGVVEKVLASPVWNFTVGNFATINCQNCGSVVRKRIPHDKDNISAACFECSATYTITKIADGKIAWSLDMVDVSCGNAACDHTIHILLKEFKQGSTWQCPACGGRNTLALGVAFEKGPSDNT